MKATRKSRTHALLLVLFLVSLPQRVAATWDFSRHAIPLAEIMSGGPPRDGIPALTDPDFVFPGAVTFLRDDEQVLGVFLHGVARAYPTRILSWHELVNDRLGDNELTLSFAVDTDRLTVVDASGRAVEQMTVYWFVWNAIWPETARY